MKETDHVNSRGGSGRRKLRSKKSLVDTLITAPIMNIDKIYSKEATSTWLNMLMIPFTKLTPSKVTSMMVTEVGEQM